MSHQAELTIVPLLLALAGCVRNRATGLYLDGMGRTTSGTAVNQYGRSGSGNQRWRILAAR